MEHFPQHQCLPASDLLNLFRPRPVSQPLKCIIRRCRPQKGHPCPLLRCGALRCTHHATKTASADSAADSASPTKSNDEIFSAFVALSTLPFLLHQSRHDVSFVFGSSELPVWFYSCLHTLVLRTLWMFVGTLWRVSLVGVNTL